MLKEIAFKKCVFWAFQIESRKESYMKKVSGRKPRNKALVKKSQFVEVRGQISLEIKS